MLQAGCTLAPAGPYRCKELTLLTDCSIDDLLCRLVIWSSGRLVVWLFHGFIAGHEGMAFIHFLQILATNLSHEHIPAPAPCEAFFPISRSSREHSQAPIAETGWLAGYPSRNSGGGSIEKTRRKSFSSRFVAAEREPIRNLYLLKNASKAKGNRKNAKHVYS